MPPKSVTLAAFLPAQLKPAEQAPEPPVLPNGQPRLLRCRCDGPFDLCWRYPAGVANAVCKPTWDKLLAPFQLKGREWTIVELRSLWPHTVQALNERLLKGRMERTLKEDLQDDLQVLVDLIQHSCKPHPRPPRAGMKTLIVQGRILAEAIAQDALFQLDPADRAAPRPERDLVDLINRLRDHHPNSLLAPALHVLRTMGNTAVHLERDSARLTDAEIGDAAAVCCRVVVLVVDAYMHMCANLHKHEETQTALAQPLLEAPVAPIPAPNVLLRPREPTPTKPSAFEGATPAATVASNDPAVVAMGMPLALPQLNASMTSHASLHVGIAASKSTPERILLSRNVTVGTGSSDGGGSGNSTAHGGGLASMSASGTVPVHSDSGVDGTSATRRRSFPGFADGPGRVPYSLVSNDWPTAVQPNTHTLASNGSGGGSGGGDGGGRPRGHSPGRRGWWPPAIVAECSHAAPPPPPVSKALLWHAEGSGQGRASGLGPLAEPGAPPQTLPTTAASSTNWLQEQPIRHGLPGAIWPAAAAASTSHFGHQISGGDGGSDGGSASSAAVAPPLPSQLPFARTLIPAPDRQQMPQLGSTAAATAFGSGQSTAAPYILAGSYICPALAPAGTTVTEAVVAAAATAAAPQLGPVQTDPWGPGDSHPSHPAGDSPRRFPISLSTGGVGFEPALAVGIAGCTVTVRSGSPNQALRGQRQSAPQPPLQHELQQPQQATAAASSGAMAAVAETLAGGGSPEASKRLLQLCAVAQPPVTAKVEKLLLAGASLTFTDKSGMTALHLACYWCHVDAVRLMLEQQPSAVAAADREGRTPLWVASQRGHAAIVEMLLALTEGAMQVDVANAAGVTPLRVAAAQGHSQVVAMLLREGANVEMADKDGFTPLYVAAARSQVEVVRLLLAAAAPVDRTDKAQRTPLWAALHPGGSAKVEASPERRAAVVGALLAAGADVHLLTDARDREYCWQLLAQSIAQGE